MVTCSTVRTFCQYWSILKVRSVSSIDCYFQPWHIEAMLQAESPICGDPCSFFKQGML